MSFMLLASMKLIRASPSEPIAIEVKDPPVTSIVVVVASLHGTSTQWATLRSSFVASP